MQEKAVTVLGFSSFRRANMFTSKYVISNNSLFSIALLPTKNRGARYGTSPELNVSQIPNSVIIRRIFHLLLSAVIS